jgi:predicted ribosome quality control (RQC) complex YloA/Tae2 family protein
MKLSMSNLDIMVCSQELKNTIDFRVDNVYELDGKVLLRLRSEKGERRDLVMELGRRVNLTERVYKAPKQPSSFAMLLRKHLVNIRLSAVEQPDFERILELKFSGAEERLLILELFSRGNLMLCDPQRKIIQPYRAEVWKHRALRAGEVYTYPPKKGADLRELDVIGLKRVLDGAPDVVRGLAINLNLGGPLAEEICARASIQKSRKLAELSDQELEAVLKSMRDLLGQAPAPCIVYEDKKPVDVLPFDFKIHFGKRVKRFNSFNEALDEYFTTLAVASAAEKRVKRLKREIERLSRRREEQQARFAELYAKSVEAKRKADLLAIHHAQVSWVLGRLGELRLKKGWHGAIAAVEEAKTAGETWVGMIKKIDPKLAKIELELAGQPVALDLRIPVFENASQLYEQYKKSAERAARSKEALEATARGMEKLMSVGMPEAEIAPPPKRRKSKWFEHYRWFISSDGMLVIAGRDAKTNSEVVEKHMEPNDRHLHADIVGAPHVVVKSGGKEVPETTIREAAEFAAMHSRAWREGLGALDVYWVMPEQVSKRAPSGSYLPKGSYVIKGERNFLSVSTRAAVGALMMNGEEVVTCGPPSAMQKHSRVVLEVSPGELKKSELAREIQSRLKASGIEASVDEIERALPPGKGKIKTGATEQTNISDGATSGIGS